MKTRIIQSLLAAGILLQGVAIVKASSPEPIQPKDTIAIICLNDFHGGFVQDVNLGVPGAGNLYSSIENLKKRYPSNMVIAVGDNFGGSFFSNLTHGKLIPYYFNELGITLSALGNHEFDNGQEFLRGKWKNEASRPANWDITYICANIELQKDGKLPDYAVADVVHQISTKNHGIVNVGLVGLVTKSAPSGTKKENVEGLIFESKYSSIVDAICKKESLTKADLQILVAHIGTEMQGNAPAWMEKDEREELSSLPESIRGIASGHSHKQVVGTINKVPVVQGEINGKYVGVLRYTWGDDKKLVAVAPMLEKVKEVSDASKGRKDIDNTIKNILDSTTEPSTQKKLTAKIATVEGDAGLLHDRNKNSRSLTALGSYVCMAYAQAYREKVQKTNMDNIVLAFCHFGGIRRSLPKGEITVLDAGEVLPFENKLRVYNLTGKEIRNIIEAGIKNGKGQLQMNNIVADSIRYNGVTRVVNVHYVVPGKSDIILNDSDTYPVVVDEFIATGGDGYATTLFPESAWLKNIDTLYTTPAFLKFLSTTLKESMNENYSFKAKLNNAEQ